MLHEVSFQSFEKTNIMLPCKHLLFLDALEYTNGVLQKQHKIDIKKYTHKNEQYHYTLFSGLDTLLVYL